jgi:glycosyltransferase involved in cell wall biosynthesis
MDVVNHYLHTQEKEGNSSLIQHVRIIHQPNAGASAARNKGVEAAKHDYIAFLDADDWWHKHYLINMKELIEEYPEAALYSSSYYQVKRGKKHPAPIGVESDFKRGYIDYCKVYARTLCMPVWTSAAVIRKKVFEEFRGFSPALKMGEDFDLWIRIVLKYKVALLNEPLAYYNHDQDKDARAVACGRIYPPGQHVIFNLGYLETEEQSNPNLKELLDALRVYILPTYFLNKATRQAAKAELDKVDWTKQPIKERILHKTPVVLLKAQFRRMLLGSKIKQYILKHSGH